MRCSVVVVAVGLTLLEGCHEKDGKDISRNDGKDVSRDADAAVNVDGGPSREIDAGPSISVEDFPSRAAEAVCSALTRCLAPANFFDGVPCIDQQGRQILDTWGDLTQLVASGRVTYRPNAAASCLTRLAAVTCSELESALDRLCEEAIQGTVAAGDACDRDRECDGDSFCLSNLGVCPGRCRERLAAGSVCARDYQCASGLDCASTCRPLAKIGEPCSGSLARCELTAECRGPRFVPESTGSCISLADAYSGKAGDPCDPNTIPLCGTGLTCVAVGDGMARQCREFAARNGECMTGYPWDTCPPGQTCGADFGMAGRCVDLPKAGDPCLGFENLCAYGLRCSDTEAASGFGVCTPYIAGPGQPCEYNEDCTTERCIRGACERGVGCAI